jgi:hypothetical protein
MLPSLLEWVGDYCKKGRRNKKYQSELYPLIRILKTLVS